MRVIEANLPDGRVIEVQVPDQWSDAQIGAEIDRIAGQQPSRPDILAGKGPIERGIIGVGRGMSNIGRQIGNIAGLISDEEMESYRQLDQPLMETTAGQVGSFVGEVAALAPVAGGVTGLLGKTATTALPALRTASAARPIATAMASGATQGALEGAVVGGPGGRGESAKMGAIAGGLTGGAFPLISKGFIRPTPEAQRLMDFGVDLTPGQMQPKSFMNLVEQAAASVAPFVKEAGESAKLETSQRIIQATRPPGAAEVPMRKLNTMLSDVYKQFDDAYKPLRDAPINNHNVRAHLRPMMERAINDPEILATKEQRDVVARFLKSQLSRIENRRIKAGDVMSIRSEVRKKIATAKRSGKWDEAELLGNAEDAITQALNNYMPSPASDLNRAIDIQYAKYKVAEDALSRMGTTRQFPTSYQWGQSIKAGTPKGQFARGAGRLRPEVEAMGSVFEQVSPPTGARIATLAAGGGLGAGAYATMDPAVLTALGGMALPLIGTRGGRRFAAGMTPWQAGLDQLLRQVPSLRVFPIGAASVGYAQQE